MSSEDSRQFEGRLYSSLAVAREWEIPEKKNKALSIVPLEDLEAIAQAKYDSTSADVPVTLEESRAVVRDLLILELLSWFKNDFFKWMNSPDCPKCKRNTVSIGNGTPNEKEASASRVELYRCSTGGCGEIVRFPRHNDPAVLLDTRVGRCGEWANCFGLICRAAGFETRYIHDFTDHVWVEVFSSAMKPRNRWLHCDPCENKCDSPLLYEMGWGKKLTFVIGASVDDIQDVTWRYTHSKNLQQVLTRRNCNEKLIIQSILRVRQQIQSGVSPSRKELLTKRLVEELVDFICPTVAEAKNSELQGRESGNLAWRLARQEIRHDNNSQECHEWKIINEKDPPEILQGSYELKYDSVSDKYVVKATPPRDFSRRGWRNGTFKVDNILRKEEHDWNQVYLAREEHGGDTKGNICWKFSIPEKYFEKGVRIRDLSLEVVSKTFHNSAKILLRITDDSEQETIIPDTHRNGEGTWSWTSSNSSIQLNEARFFLLNCELLGGSGNVAWQHSQIFRQSTTSAEDSRKPGLRVVINFFCNNDSVS